MRVEQDRPLVSVIIPTYNNEETIGKCLDSLNRQNYNNIEIIVVDNHSQDATQSIIADFDVVFQAEETTMPEARKKGAQIANGKYYFHVDSDMVVTEQVISECVESCEEEYNAVVIPERNIGSTFWANCTDFGKRVKNKSRVGNLRFISSNIYDSIGGHDPELVAGEDRDLHIRAVNAGAKVSYASSCIHHLIGELTLRSYIKDCLYYSKTVSDFDQKDEEDREENTLDKKVLVVESGKRPLHSMGFLILNVISYIIYSVGRIH